MAVTTDQAYNSDDRMIEQKFIFYFLGMTPLEITRDNYLLSSSSLEELHSDVKSPFGNVTANDVRMSLLNEESIFSPTNEASPYFGKMRKGTKVESFIRPVDLDGLVVYDWDMMGTFYVSDWTATITGLTAAVTVSDIFFFIFDAPSIPFNVTKNISYSQFYATYFENLGVIANIDESLIDTLKYAYITQSNKDFLTALSLGSQADCFCAHNGIPKVQSMYAPRALRATLTDGEQIVSVEAQQSITNEYDGASVTCNAPQESAQESILAIKDLVITEGINNLTGLQLTKKPLIRFIGAVAKNGYGVKMSYFKATPSQIDFVADNTTGASKIIELDITGTCIDNVKTEIADAGSKLLSVDNIYVQDMVYAEAIKQKLGKYVDNTVPQLKIKIRGNPLLNLGDKLRIVSERFKLDYTGILVRSTMEYTGSLSSTITLINASILEVTP